jgi:hypothetical protein
MERFIEGEKIKKEESLIKWNDIQKIILVLILFAYFNNITADGYNLIKYGLKFVLLFVIIDSIFKDSNIYKFVKDLITKYI